MKIGYVLTHPVEEYFQPWENSLGFQHMLDTYALAVARLGHTSLKYVPSPEARQASLHKHEIGHSVRRVPTTTRLLRGALFKRTPYDVIGFTFNVRRLLKLDGIDIVHYAMYYSSYFVPSFILPRGLPIIVQYTGGELPGGGRSARGWLWRMALALALKRADAVLVPEYAYDRGEVDVLQRVLHVPPGKIYDFPLLAVDTDLFKQAPKDKARHVVGFDDGCVNVLCVSRIPSPDNRGFMEKDPFLMLEIFAGAIKELPEVRLHVAGWGPGEADLKNMIEGLGLNDKVRYIGYVDHAALPAYYNAADLLFMPYQFRKLNDGLATIEAWACRLPVSGFRRDNLADIEQTGGFLVNMDIDTAVKILAERLLDLNYLAQKGNEGFKCVKTYSIDAIGRRLQEIYEDILTGKNRDKT